MVRKMLVVVLVSGAMASVGLADIILQYEPDTIPDATTTNVTISLHSNPGTSFLLAGMGFAYDPDSEAYQALNPNTFDWTFVPIAGPGCGDPNQWFCTTDLPTPQAVAFIPGVELGVPDGEKVEMATINFKPGAHEDITKYNLRSGFQAFDENLEELTIKEGNDFSITVLPEPASLGLLALGALVAVRRRR
jgi:hypothetical protein